MNCKACVLNFTTYNTCKQKILQYHRKLLTIDLRVDAYIILNKTSLPCITYNKTHPFTQCAIMYLIRSTITPNKTSLAFYLKVDSPIYPVCLITL